MSGLPERPGLRARQFLRLRARRLRGKNVHLKRRQSDSATGNSERAGPEIDHDRQDRSPPEIYFEKRPPFFRASKVGQRQSRFRIRRESAENEEGAGTKDGCRET